MTFAFTDVVGSTRKYAEYGDAYVEALHAMHRRVARYVTDHDGVVVNTQGDGAFLAFPDAASAVGCLRSLQDPGEPGGSALDLPLRAGAHCGDAVAVDGDYVSYAIHVAARVTSAANAGQALVSQSVIDELPEAAGERLGAFDLKDVAEPVVLWRVAGDPQPPRAPLARRTNVAQSRTSFVGREQEMARLRGLASDPGLVCLVGPGGVGKTRLVTELALADATSWPGGAWLVELSAVEDADAVAEAVAATLGLTRSASRRAIAEELGHRGQVLLIVDNCEHLIDSAADLIGDLTERCPAMTVVATSREPLSLDGERVIRLAPLDVSEEDHGRSPAQQLFVERAGAVGAPLVAKDWAAVADICTSLDGVPLALELAAAHASDMALDDLATAIRQGELSLNKRGGAHRHRNLEDLVSWSLRLLPLGDLRAVLGLVAADGELVVVLPGRFSADTARQILSNVPGASSDAVPRLSRQSLVDRDGPRYRMLMVIRTVLRGELKRDPELDAAAHAAVFAWAVRTSKGLEDVLILDEDLFDRDVANTLEDALAWGLARSSAGSGAVLRTLSGWALEHLRTSRYNAMCEQVLASPVPLTGADRIMLVATALRARVGIAAHTTMAPWDRVPELLGRVRELADPEMRRHSLHSLAVYCSGLGDHTGAQSMMMEELALIDRTESLSRWRALFLGDLGVAQHLDGELDAAEASYRESIDECDRTDQTRSKTASVVNLAELMLDRQRPEEARSLLVAALPSLQRYEVRHAMGTALLVEALWLSDSPTEALMLEPQARAQLERLVAGDSSLRFYLDRLERRVGKTSVGVGHQPGRTN